MLNRFNWVIFVITIFTLIFPTAARAQQQSGIAISPPSFEINAKAGDTIKNTIKVENLSKTSYKIKVSARNFTAYGDGGQVSITEEQNSFSIDTWISFDKQSFTIPASSTSLFTFTIKIPKSAEPGSHYGAVVFSSDNTQTAGETGAALQQEIGSLILIKIPGNIYEKADLVSFGPTDAVFKDPKIKLNALISNAGNVHIKPYGFITIKNILGMKVKTIEVRGRNILPGSKRIFDEEFAFGSIGYYTAELTLLYSGGSNILHADSHFIALNQNMLVKYLSIGGGILVIYLFLRKRINKALAILIKGQ